MKQSGSNGGGYIDGPDIRDNLKAIGFSESDTLDVLGDLCHFRFAHTKSHGKADFSSSYFASRLGGHVIRNLVSDFTFIENVMMDTFIADKACWERLKNISTQVQEERDIVNRIKLRAERAEIFYEFMLTEYIRILNEALKRGLDPVWLTNPLEELKNTLDANLQKAVQSAIRNYG